MNKLGRLRVSCAVGYLAPARIRPNLTIQADTFVRRLVIEDGCCRGVEVEATDGSVSSVNAKLVVLAAGALMSPQILMLSGVGAAAALLIAFIPTIDFNDQWVEYFDESIEFRTERLTETDTLRDNSAAKIC